MKSLKLCLVISLFALVGIFMGATSGQATLTGLEEYHGLVPTTNWTDALSTPEQITATGTWNSSTGGTSLAWEITPMGSFVHYKYTWTTPDKNLSHLILEVSEGARIWNEASNVTEPPYEDAFTEGPTTYSPTDPGNSNPGMPGPIYGMKTISDKTYFVFEFDSDRLPMWGNFYAKDGTDKVGTDHIDVYAFNSGFTSPQGETGFFAAVPDTRVVPLPGALFLLGPGLVGLVGFRKRIFK